MNGELTTIDDQPLINLAYQFRTAPVMLLSAIDENDVFNSYLASVLFQTPALQDKVLDNVVSVMTTKGYLGLDIDFEFIALRMGKDVFILGERTASRLNPLGYFVDVPICAHRNIGRSSRPAL